MASSAGAINDLEHATSYTPLLNNPVPAGQRRRLPIKNFSYIFLSVLFVSFLVVLVIYNPLDQEVPKAATTGNGDPLMIISTSFASSRGVLQGVSEKSFRLQSDADVLEIYPWTNAMLSWQRTSFHFQPEKNWMNGG